MKTLTAGEMKAYPEMRIANVKTPPTRPNILRNMR